MRSLASYVQGLVLLDAVGDDAWTGPQVKCINVEDCNLGSIMKIAVQSCPYHRNRLGESIARSDRGGRGWEETNKQSKFNSEP